MLQQLQGEFCGTMVLIILGDGVVASTLLQGSKGYQAGWIAITLGWFVAVVMGCFVAQFTGSPNADINPAISFAKWWMHDYTLHQALLFSCAQVAGAFVGAVLIWLAYLPHWKITNDANYKLMVFSTKPAIRAYPANLICEIIGTAILVFGVLAIFGRSGSNTAPVNGLGPYLVGLLVLGIGLSLGGPTGYAINPARDFGPRLAHAVLPIGGKGGSDWAYAWVPVLGPIMGAYLAVVLTQMITV